MSLRVYNQKRKFKQTPEPKGKKGKGRGPLRFVVQMHHASRLHFDFRLEFGGVYNSWAVPKGPSLNPLDQRLAVYVEDHPLAYGSFEGVIPKGNYGAGTVMIWDAGTFVERGSKTRAESEIALTRGLAKGHITFVLDGEKLKGEFALIQLKKDSQEKAWLLVKKRDEHATFKRGDTPGPLSILSGRTIEEIAATAETEGKIWLPKRTPKVRSKPATKPKRRPQQIMPRKNKPMLATVRRDNRLAEGWLLEADPGGLRALAEVEGKRISLYSRSGLPFERKFPQLVEELKTQSAPMVLDGVIVTGSRAGAGQPIYYVWDVLYAQGRDLRQEPLRTRKKVLKECLREGKCVRLIDQFKGGKGVGKIAKDLSSPYRAGTSTTWCKVSATVESAKIAVDSIEPRLTNLDKIYWPKEEITKGDLIEYYRAVAPFILPYLKDRPESLNRHPSGITRPGFYQKDMTGYLPKWFKTERLFSESAAKSIDYALCQDERSLLYIVNLGCIEINPWLSRVGHLDRPDFLVIDLDPNGNDFKHVIEIAHEVHEVLSSIGAPNFCKTSGATGIHIGVPTGARYSFDEVRDFAEKVCRVVGAQHPATTSLERSPSRRRGKIYLDFMQNRRAQTLAAPFCVRPREGAPVSMPVTWKELTPRLRPEQFHLKNAMRRIARFDDPWRAVLGKPLALPNCLKRLERKV